ncbi:hypothetical protein AJ80_02839 [Polytolypa hystricis UAMH7299]|uniref:Uncharacterized protein n=1 Tax=Polytolypa hystricis (strain UAMH7299) TaxID=1447883 RepID=A0A2B7YP33_POLH7|nr:hypothetical protein AJ80_02839 [Polytolypa hystricis UAMH7299]
MPHSRLLSIDSAPFFEITRKNCAGPDDVRTTDAERRIVVDVMAGIVHALDEDIAAVGGGEVDGPRGGEGEGGDEEEG